MDLRPGTMLPKQAPPIDRSGPMAPDAQVQDRGVDAAATKCAGLTGMAQQICYALKYGAST
jgi:hypothetical protein